MTNNKNTCMLYYLVLLKKKKKKKKRTTKYSQSCLTHPCQFNLTAGLSVRIGYSRLATRRTLYPPMMVASCFALHFHSSGLSQVFDSCYIASLAGRHEKLMRLWAETAKPCWCYVPGTNWCSRVVYSRYRFVYTRVETFTLM